MTPRRTEEIRFAVDLTGVEEADDGDTTSYGGVYRLDGTEYPAVGNDRGDNHYRDLAEKIHDLCAEKWPKLRPILKADTFQDELNEAVTDGFPESCDLYDLVVIRRGTRFEVRTEELSRASKDRINAKLPPAVRGAKEIGDLLGDLLAEHLDENEDWLAEGLANSIAENPLCKKAEVVRKDGEVFPTDATKNIVLEEAMGYVREAVKGILWKALNPSPEGTS